MSSSMPGPWWRRTWVWVVVAGSAAVVALTVEAVVVVRIYSHHFGAWPKIRREAQTFVVPSGFDEVGRREEGSEACVVSCNEPRISIVLQTDLSPAQACAKVEQALAQFGPLHRYQLLPGTVCEFYADLPGAGSDAVVGAEVLPVTDVVDATWIEPWQRNLVRSRGGLVATVGFHSGID